MNKQVNLIIIACEKGAGKWTPVLPADVPEWVKDPDNIARLVQGYECSKKDEGMRYRGVRVEEYERIMAAEAKRERRKRRLH